MSSDDSTFIFSPTQAEKRQIGPIKNFKVRYSFAKSLARDENGKMLSKLVRCSALINTVDRSLKPKWTRESFHGRLYNLLKNALMKGTLRNVFNFPVLHNENIFNSKKLSELIQKLLIL